MANPEHLEILKQGVEIWNNWRKENPDSKPHLSWANLSGANLSGADLSFANLSRTNLSFADLSETNLLGVKLNFADLSEANLSGSELIGAHIVRADLHRADLRRAALCPADLSEAYLREARISEADLGGASLSKANLRGADLTGANLFAVSLNYTIFGDANLNGVKGLDECKHLGPSIIDQMTLVKSGRLPEVFLKGCGLSDDFIKQIPFLFWEKAAFEFNSCFISYSTQDKDFAERLYADLQNNGVRCWFAPEDMKIGDEIRQRIDETIRLYDKLLLILSENSINSAWVKKEVETAFEKENRHKHSVLFPIRLDEQVMQTHTAWAADIRRTRHIGDFSRWKDHDAYKKAFERLLKDLKAS